MSDCSTCLINHEVIRNSITPCRKYHLRPTFKCVSCGRQTRCLVSHFYKWHSLYSAVLSWLVAQFGKKKLARLSLCVAPPYMKFVDRIGVSHDHMMGNKLFLNQQIRLPYYELELLICARLCKSWPWCCLVIMLVQTIRFPKDTNTINMPFVNCSHTQLRLISASLLAANNGVDTGKQVTIQRE